MLGFSSGYKYSLRIIRELKQRRRLVKNEFIIYKRNSRLFRSARYPNGSEWRRGPRSVQDAELGNFTLLFGSGRQRNVQRFIMHVHSYWFAR